MLNKVSSLLLLASLTCAAQQTPSFTVGWSVYVGWDPYYYMAKAGILRKWGAKYGVNIRVRRFDYAPSLDAFVSSDVLFCALADLEARQMPGFAHIATHAAIVVAYADGDEA